MGFSVLADGLRQEIPAIQHLSLFNRACLLRLGQRQEDRRDELGWSKVEVGGIGVPIQVPGVSRALPKLLPLAGAGLLSQLRA